MGTLHCNAKGGANTNTAGRVMANNGKWSGRLDSFHERLLEVERIISERYRPPSRLGSAFRWYLENVDTIKEIIEERKNAK
jgi:hypothetical protein